jgi:hypothetical protein
VKIVGTGHFQGDVGSYQGETHTIEGRAPFSTSFPYKEADYVFTHIDRDSQEAVKLLIKDGVVEKDKDGVVEKGGDEVVVKKGKDEVIVESGKGSTFLMWESPRRDTR